jgi:large subunit ribosomal protein L10
MSKPVKELIRKDLAGRFEGLTSLAIVGFTGVDAVTTNQIRGRLREKNITLTVVKNSLARQAFKAVGLDVAAGLLDGPCAVAYGADSLVAMVRELKAIGEESPGLTVKAAVLEGEPYQGEEQVEALSLFPTREEAISQIAACVVGAGGGLAGCLVAPGGCVAALVQAVEEKHGAAAA